MTELTFAILKYGFVLALWLFAWMAVRSLHHDVSSFLPKRNRGKRKRTRDSDAVVVGGQAPAVRQDQAPVHVAGNATANAPSNAADMATQPVAQGTLSPGSADHLAQLAATTHPTEPILPLGMAASSADQAGSAANPADPTLLIIIDGPLAGSTVPLTGVPITLGRGTSNTVVLDDEYVSSQHARVSLDPTTHQWVLEDLGSTNGTYVNEKRVTGTMNLPARLPVRVGATTFELR